MSKEKKAITPDAVEFQSDALELEHTRLPWFGRCGISLAALFLVAAVIWASVFEIDTIVIANGKIIASTQNITMKPLERTVIKKVNVDVGQLVKKDQILITFDPTFNQAEEERLQEQFNSLTAQFSRLKAEFSDNDYLAGINSKDNNVLWQAAIFKKRQKFFREKIRYFTQNQKRIEAAINTTRESFEKQQERLKTLERIENMLEGLYKKNSISLKQLLETQISRLQMESDVESLKNRIIELEHEQLSAEASKNSFVEDWSKTLSEDMVKTEREMTSVRKQLDKAVRLNSLVVLRSPCDAIVHEIAAFSSGSGVREAEPLITLVPVNCLIEAEVNINPRDIGKVKRGDAARIKLNAFPFQKHDTLEGKIRLLSENTFQEPDAAGQKNAVYRARIIITGKLEHVPDNFRLIPGMELSAEIKVGRRRIITYLIYPLVKALDESCREP